MKRFFLFLAILCTLTLCCCGDKTYAEQPSAQADFLNETGAVIGAGDTYDSQIYLEGEPFGIAMMRLYSDRGYSIDYPFEYFDYISGEGSDRFIWLHESDPQNPRNYAGITAMPEDAAACAKRLESELAAIFDSITAMDVDLNGTAARLLYCSQPASDSGLAADTLADHYIIPTDDGCRTIELHYTLESAEDVYQYMLAMLRTFTPTVG